MTFSRLDVPHQRLHSEPELRDAFAGQSPLLTLTPQTAQFLVISPFGLPVFLSREPSVLFARLAIIAVGLAVFALAAIVALAWSERGVQDRLAGTWLVPVASPGGC